ncbi:MAG: hypothetical protein AAFN43_00890, partial [Pseudomonadota bacterium]
MKKPALAPSSTRESIPVFAAGNDWERDLMAPLSSEQVKWANSNGFTGKAGQVLKLPGIGGELAAVLFGTGGMETALETGRLPSKLPEGRYHLDGDFGGAYLASLG